MAATSELQTPALEGHAPLREHGSGSGHAEQLGEGGAGVVGRIFGAAPGEPSDNATQLLRSPALAHSANQAMRAVVLRSAQQTRGNQFAQRVVRGLQGGTPRLVQRECACGTCAKCRASASPSAGAAGPVVALSSRRLIQAQRAASSPAETTEAPAGDRLIPTESPGEPLDEPTRAFMEARFKRDLKDVRVHRDARSAQSADTLDADAYTTGRDIYFAAGKYEPETQEGRHLIAHEIAHTIQQGQGAASDTIATASRHVIVGAVDDPLEAEADRAADDVAGAGDHDVALSPDAQRPVRRSWIGSAWDATGGRVVSYVGEKVEGAIEAVEDWVIDKIEEYAPGLLKLLRGGVVGYVKDRIVGSLDDKFGEVTSRVQKDGFLGAVAGTFGELTTGVGKAASSLVAGACESFAQVAETVTGFARSLAGPLFDGIRTVAGWVGKFFSFIWNNIIGPVWEGIRSIAGTVWHWIEDTAKWIWDKTAFIRKTIGRAWNWIKRQFGVAWDSGTGVLDWLKEKAKGAWDWLVEFTKPIHGPLKIIGGVLLLLSPFGPVIAIWKGAPVLWDALTWLYNQWKKTDFIVLGRKALTEHILPAVVDGTQFVAGLLESAANWIVGTVDSINEGLGGLLDALGVTSLLSFAKRAVQFVADAFRKFANWAKNDFVKTLRQVKAVLLKIWSFVKPILAFLLKLVIVVANPLLLPIVITGYLWQALPDCFKPPIIDFILDLLIAVVRALPTFKILGEAWPPAKAKILGALTEVRNSGIDEKIAASNRVARIMSGDDLAWLGNLLSAMYQVPDHLEGQFEEELIGMNLTEPLPFERGEVVAKTPVAEPAGPASEPMSAADAAVLDRAVFTDANVGVDRVATGELDPALIAQLNLGEQGSVEFGESNDPSRSLGAVKDELMGQGAGAAVPHGATPAGAPVAEAGTATMDSAAAPKTTEERLQEMMNQPMPQTCTTAKEHEPAKAADVPEYLKFGPLTKSQRASYLLNQMGKGVKSWFSCNAKWLVPALILVAAALIAVEILTGGAVTAALPPLMEIIGAIMIGVAMVRVAGYVADYLAKAVTNDTLGAAKSLARGLAVGAIELVFALLFNIGDVIKVLKGELKLTVEGAVKAAKTAVRTSVESVEELGRIGVKGLKTAGANVAKFGKAVIKNGKILLEGVGEGIGRGAKTLGELAERLWNKVRFRKFRITFSRGWFTLEGWINPWIVLMKGPFKGQFREVTEESAQGVKVGTKSSFELAESGGKVEGKLLSHEKDVPTDYRGNISKFLGKSVDDSVVHHLIERQAGKLSALVDDLLLHAPANLRLIPKGIVNNIVHLSEIRKMWNSLYRGLSGLSDEAVLVALKHFAAYTDEFIAHMLRAVKAAERQGKPLTREMLRDIAEQWFARPGNGLDAARDAAIQAAKQI